MKVLLRKHIALKRLKTQEYGPGSKHKQLWLWRLATIKTVLKKKLFLHWVPSKHAIQAYNLPETVTFSRGYTICLVRYARWSPTLQLPFISSTFYLFTKTLLVTQLTSHSMKFEQAVHELPALHPSVALSTGTRILEWIGRGLKNLGVNMEKFWWIEISIKIIKRVIIWSS